MKLLDLLNYVIVAVVLLAIGYVAKVTGIWSFYTSISIPFICFTLAASLMIATVACLVCQKQLAELSWTAIIVVYSVFFVISGIGVLVYYLRNWMTFYSSLMSLVDWIEGSAILALVFVLPRLKKQ